MLVAVGWHTPAKRALRAACTGQRRVLWSNGLATPLSSTGPGPILGVLSWLSRCPELLAVVATLRRCDRLVAAYPRRSRWDERSVDVVLARWLHVLVAVIGNPVDTDFWRPAPAGAGQTMDSVLSMGRFELQKGHWQALSIVVSVPASLRLQVFAPAGSADGKALHLQAQRQGQPEQLELLLGLDPEQRRRVLQQSLCLLSCSETDYPGVCDAGSATGRFRGCWSPDHAGRQRATSSSLWLSLTGERSWGLLGEPICNTTMG